MLFKGAGSSAVDDIIPSLLSGLDGTERQAAQVHSTCHVQPPVVAPQAHYLDTMPADILSLKRMQILVLLEPCAQV